MATATRSFVTPACVLFEVEIRDAEKWKDFSLQLKPVLAAAGPNILSEAVYQKPMKATGTLSD